MAFPTNIQFPDITQQDVVDGITKVKNSIDQYVVSPANAFGLGGFVFDIEDETQIFLNTEITDHYVEDNSAIQDHIATRPLRVTLGTYVGETVYSRPSDSFLDDAQSVVQDVTQKLNVINAYIPTLTDAGNQVKNLFEGDIDFQDAQDTTLDLFGAVSNLNPTASKQQQAYVYFKAMYEQKIIVGLQTPFEFLPNMAIESITATQDSLSQNISNFSITLKQIRTASTINADFQPQSYQSRTKQQREPQDEKSGVVGRARSLAVRFLGL